ncbi:hypothetical protein FQA39_LY07637 [Lamprigera yunnana]|nr:hypothetical protein FQA39_LY07637 [Lamprigera yunnana]
MLSSECVWSKCYAQDVAKLGGKDIRLKVCSSVVSVNRHGQLRGTEEDPTQIDEARFAGRRKYKTGRMLNGDHPAESDESDAEIEINRNHGRRNDGPWVFGLSLRDEVRYYYVERRDRVTLVRIIQREELRKNEDDKFLAF